MPASTPVKPVPDHPQAPARKSRDKEIRAKRAKKAVAYAQLAKHFPYLFNIKQVRPLALGVHNEIFEMVDAGRLPFTRTTVRQALSGWTHKSAYLKTIAKGGPRYDLWGEPQGEISEREMLAAQSFIYRGKKKRPHGPEVVAAADARQNSFEKTKIQAAP